MTNLAPEIITAERAAVVATMCSFLGTPYHHKGEKPGVGLDCVTSLREAVIRTRIIDRVPLEHYPPDWHLHRDAERYIAGLVGYCCEMPGPGERFPLPGDLALFRFGRTYSHGAMVEEWPWLLHAQLGAGCIRSSYELEANLRIIGERGAEFGHPRPMKIFALKRWVE